MAKSPQQQSTRLYFRMLEDGAEFGVCDCSPDTTDLGSACHKMERSNDKEAKVVTFLQRLSRTPRKNNKYMNGNTPQRARPANPTPMLGQSLPDLLGDFPRPTRINTGITRQRQVRRSRMTMGRIVCLSALGIAVILLAKFVNFNFVPSWLGRNT